MASQYIVVVGCGRLGSILASRLSSQGNNVVVIDPYESSFNNLSSDFSGFQITGDASEIEILRSAKADKADCLLAVTDKDNINLMVAQVAKNILQIGIETRNRKSKNVIFRRFIKIPTCTKTIRKFRP